MYDDKEEKFKQVDLTPQEKEALEEKGIALFQINQVFIMNGIPMRVRKITKKDIILRRITRKELDKKMKEKKE